MIEPGALKALDLAGRGYRVRHNTVPAPAQASTSISYVHNYIQPKSMCIKEKNNARGGVTRRSGALFGTGGDTHGSKAA